MTFRKALMATASLALAASVGASVCAQTNPTSPVADAPGARPRPVWERPRHLVYIATPGDDGADGQSGVIVLDADHDYRFLKRIPYGLPASQLPGPKISGMTASVPANKIYVT